MSRDLSKQRKGASEGMSEEALAEEVESSDVLKLADISDASEALRSLVIGHKKALMDDGFSEVSAEEMAVSLHDVVVDDFFD